MSASEPPRIPPSPHSRPLPEERTPPADAFVARIKAGTVARKGRGRWLFWGLALCVALVIWFLARPWFTSAPQHAADEVNEFMDNGGTALMGVVAYAVLGLVLVASLFALQALWMFLFELVMPRRLSISAEGIGLVRGLRRVHYAWPRIASVEIVPGTGPKPRPTLILRPLFDYTAPDPFDGQRLSWTTARSPWRDKGTDTIGLCRLDELNTTPGHLEAALRHFTAPPRQGTPVP